MRGVAQCGLRRFDLAALQFGVSDEARGLQSLGDRDDARCLPVSGRVVRSYGGCGRNYRAVHRLGSDDGGVHYDLEGQGPEFAAGHCWLPGQMSPVIAALRTGFAAEATARWGRRRVRSKSATGGRNPSDGLRANAGEENRSGAGHQQMSTVGGDSGEDGSTRFPGKVLQPIGGKAILLHLGGGGLEFGCRR